MKKCAYCNFNSIKYDSRLVDEYLGAIEKEVDRVKERFNFKTIFLGGGTPTSLNEKQLKRLLGAVNRCVDSSFLDEYTIEANPGTLSSEKLRIITSNSVNRVSIGVQSFNDNRLHMLGRIHTGEDSKKTISLLRQNGVDNINIDLIFGLHLQSVEEWENDLNAAVSLETEHISTYSLTYEDGTPFKNLLLDGVFEPVNEDVELEMYKLSIGKLGSAGLEHYEISNFARKGKVCEHNIVYWENSGYVGIGAGAFSFVDGCRESKEKEVSKYIDKINSNEDAITFSEKLTREEYAAETMIMGLRLRSGVNENRFLRQTGFGFTDVFGSKIAELEELGLVSLSNGKLKLTNKGLYVADSVMVEFLN